MEFSEASSIVMYPTRNLYLTAIAELDDDQLLELVAGASMVLEEYSKDTETREEAVAKRKALLDTAQMAAMLHSSYEQRARERKLRSGRVRQTRQQGESQAGQRGKILLFRPQSHAWLVGSLTPSSMS